MHQDDITSTSNMLESAFSIASSRINPRKASIKSQLIPILILLISVFIFGLAYFVQGIFAWSAGLSYILYDTSLLVFVAWQTSSLIKNKANVSVKPKHLLLAKEPTIGVIIAAYNEAEVIERTIIALLKQSYPPEQILIVDDGSNDGMAQKMADLYGFSATSNPAFSQPLISSQLPNLFWLCVPRGGKARALNWAIPHMNTDVIVTVDADTLLDFDAINVMHNAFTHEPELVAATGVLTPICSNKMIGKFLQWFQTYE